MTREKKRKQKGSNVSVSNNNTIKRFNDSRKEETTENFLTLRLCSNHNLFDSMTLGEKRKQQGIRKSLTLLGEGLLTPPF